MLKQTIKNLLRSPNSPDLLYNLYFKQVARTRIERIKVDIDKIDERMKALAPDQRKHWLERLKIVVEGPDNKDIPRVKDAGKLIGDHFIMHNGLKIDPLSYYNLPVLKILLENKGVHEPQEEKIFQAVLQSLTESEQAPKTMLELGAYWAFYSMWFLQVFPTAKCYLVEPNRNNLFYGKKNFKLNQLKGKFIHAGIGAQSTTDSKTRSVDDICKKNNIEFLDLLHADIQGYELDMLHGAKEMLAAKRVGYIFVSTHSNELHENCRKLLKKEYDLIEVASADLDESYSWDGILVMKAKDYPGVSQVPISKRKVS